MVSRSSDWSPVALRLGLGVIFLVSGLGKLLGVGPKATGPGISGFAGFLDGLGVPAPVVFAWIVALVETGSGVAFLLGIFVRYAAILIAVDMLVALLLVHVPNGFPIANGGVEYALLLFLTAISLALSGAGRLSLETALLGRELLPVVKRDRRTPEATGQKRS